MRAANNRPIDKSSLFVDLDFHSKSITSLPDQFCHLKGGWTSKGGEQP